MTIQKTTTDLSTLKINYLTQQMYEDALENDEINENELYITPGSGSIESTDIPTADKVAEFDSTAHMNSTDMTSSEVEDFVEDLDMGASGLLNMFYPVGSYYETSDSTFDPNVRWGGTWVQDTQIHEKKINLYNGTFTSGSATLNESVENFFKLEITYATNDGDISTLDVVNNYTDDFVVSIDKTRIISGWYTKAIYVTFSTTTMSSGNNKQAYFSTVSANGTYISIKRVDGCVQTTGYIWHRTA